MRLVLLCWLSLTVIGVAGAAEDLARRTLIVYNENEPDGLPLARYYAEKRNIPTSRICALKVRNVETITRREFNEQIREPLRKFMIDRELLFEIGGKTYDNKIDCLVLMYGMPLRIDADLGLKEVVSENVPNVVRRNEASVDSELTTLPSPGMNLTAWLPNPFFGAPSTRFVSPLNYAMLLVGRIDGPSAAIAQREIDHALAVERYGLLGRCYFDARNAQEAGYVAGDQWIKESYRQFQAAGYECELEETGDVIAEEYPMTDVAVYAGWYTSEITGPFRRATFQFRRGAVAYHLHSSSAYTIKKQEAWVGPLLAKGADASFGNTFEPYLAVTPRLDLFFKRLLDGASYVDAGWYSVPGLSWQTVFVGDPLYRPFTVPVDEQITRLESDQQPDLEWAYLRKVNLLWRAGETNAALALCRSKAEALRSPVLAEKLGDLLPVGERVPAYEAALKNAGETYRYLRIGLKLATTYSATRRPGQALAVYEGLLTAHPTGRNARLILERARDLANLAGEAEKAEAFQQKLTELIAAETVKKK